MKRRYLVQFGLQLEGRLSYAEIVEADNALHAVTLAITQAKDNKRFPWESSVRLNDFKVTQLCQVGA